MNYQPDQTQDLEKTDLRLKITSFPEIFIKKTKCLDSA